MSTPREMLDRLDTRHDELIRKLDELNTEVEATLAQFVKSRGETSQPTGEVSDAVAGAIAPAQRSASRRAA